MRLPLRWDRPNREIVDADGNDVCSVDSDSFGYDDDDRHAAEIVAACNSHARLMELLERYERLDIDVHGTDAEWSQFRRDVAAATGSDRQ